MHSTFWSHTIWYVLLGIATLIELIVVLTKGKDKKHIIALFIIASGSIFSVEVMIYCFFRVYDYYPMIFPESPIDDGLAGNLFSQFSLTASALIIAVLQLKYYWKLLFAGVYYIIEELFLQLGIYSHNFYDNWVTFFALLVLFTVIKLLYKHKAIYTKNRVLKYYFMFLGLYTLHMPTALWIQILVGIVKPSTTFLSNEMNSYALICLLNLVLLSSVCTFVYFSKIGWVWKSIITTSLYGILYLADYVGLLNIEEGWFFIFSTINIFAMFFYVFILNNLMTKPRQS